MTPEPRVITSATTRQRECMVVATVLQNPSGVFGPNILTAISDAHLWEDPMAGAAARAIRACINSKRPPTTCTILEYLPKGHDLLRWMTTRDFDRAATTLGLAEFDAYDLVRRYQGKKILELLGSTLERVRNHPENALAELKALNVKSGEYK